MVHLDSKIERLIIYQPWISARQKIAEKSRKIPSSSSCSRTFVMSVNYISVLGRAPRQSPQFSTGPREGAKETFRGPRSFIHEPNLLQPLQL
jgi:hypothetical protein